MEPKQAQQAALKEKRLAEADSMKGIKGSYKTFFRASGGKYLVKHFTVLRDQALREAEKQVDPYVVMKFMGQAKAFSLMLDHIERMKAGL